MMERNPVFPNVIEVNHQLGRITGCNVFLVYDDRQWVLIDIGYEETVDEIIELIRQLDFPFANCMALIATHADVDHIQGLAKAKQILRAPVWAHPEAVHAMTSGDTLSTFAEIAAQDIHLAMPAVEVDRTIAEGDVLEVGGIRLQVWWTPGHTNSQIALRFGNLLFSGDNIYRDGCVGAIDAHHGSDLPSFVRSLRRIAACDAEWLLPGHGPIFRRDATRIQATIDRLIRYQSMSDFGTCAVDWPLMDEWESELAKGQMPGRK